MDGWIALCLPCTTPCAWVRRLVDRLAARPAVCLTDLTFLYLGWVGGGCWVGVCGGVWRSVCVLWLDWDWIVSM